MKRHFPLNTFNFMLGCQSYHKIHGLILLILIQNIKYCGSKTNSDVVYTELDDCCYQEFLVCVVFFCLFF